MPSSFKDILDNLLCLVPEARGATSLPRGRVSAPFQSTRQEVERTFTKLKTTAVVEDATRVAQERLEKEVKSDKLPSLHSLPPKKHRPFQMDGDPAVGAPLGVNPSLVAAFPACAKSKTLKDRVTWTLADLMGLEQSARTMRDIQNFNLWMVAGVVRHYQQFLAPSHPQHKTVDGLLDILAMSMSQLSGEVSSLMAFAIGRRREHYLSLLPSTISVEEKRLLKASPISGPLIFADQSVRDGTIIVQDKTRRLHPVCLAESTCPTASSILYFDAAVRCRSYSWPFHFF